MKKVLIVFVMLALAMQACFNKQDDPNAELQELLEKQDFQILEHLEQQGITNAEKDEKGVYVRPLTTNPEGEEVAIGDVAEVEYKITQLDGTLIGENPDTTMRLGRVPVAETSQHLFIPYALYHALQYVKSGERYQFFVPFTYGYGEYELANVVPKQSIIVLELEVKEVLKTKDELLNADLALIDSLIADRGQEDTVLSGGVRKVLLQAGEGEKADEGDVAKVYYSGSFLTGKVFDHNTRAGDSPLSVSIGAGSVIPGFEEAVKSMRKGEKAIFYLPSQQAYAGNGWYVAPEAVREDLKTLDQGRYRQQVAIPPHSPLVFEIEMADLTKK